MKNINLMFLTTSLIVGGAEKGLYETVLRIDRSKYDVSVCCIKSPGYYGKELEKHGIPVIYLGMGDKTSVFVALRFFSILMKLAGILKSKKIDILHCQLFRANFIGAIAARLAGAPVVITSILGGVREKRYHFWLYRLTNRLVDLVIANSEVGRQYTIRKSGIDEKKIVTIYNGIDINNFKPDKDIPSIKKEFMINPGDRIIGTIGRLHRIKGQVFLLRALPEILKHYPGLKMLIVGRGELLQDLKSESSRLGISDSVVFTGERKDTAAMLSIKDTANMLSIMDVFILPSLSEGISNAIIEAMASGLPVVATNSGGTPELVVDGKTGLLVEPENPAAISAAVLRLLNDEEKAGNMGVAGRKVIGERFLLSGTVSKTEAVYEKLVNKTIKAP